MNVTLAPGASLRRIAEIVRNAVLFGPDAWGGASLPDQEAKSSQPQSVLPTDRDVLELFTLLRQRQIPYLLVGGIAMLRYVEGRNTEDIDLLMSLPSLKQLPDFTLDEQNGFFIKARFRSVRVDVLLTANALFAEVQQCFGAAHRFAELDVPTATPGGLVLLKLYALPSLYRQGQIDRVTVCEADITSLVQRYRCDVEPLFQRLQSHLIESDLQELRGIVRDIQARSRIVCLQPLLDTDVEIYWAQSSQPWPGTAAIDVALISFGPKGLLLPKVLNGAEVPFIDSALSPNDPSRRDPVSLKESEDRAFEGAKVAGDGFIISPDEARTLIQASPQAADVVKPYLNGDDINQNIASRPSQWVINFKGLPLYKTVGCDRAAQDYPECLRIVEERVRPERQKLDDETAWNRGLKARWWQFGLWRPAIDSAMRDKTRAFVTSKVTAHHVFVPVSPEIVCADSVLVVCLSEWRDFSIIQSNIHGAWAHRPGAMTLGTTLRYQPTFAFVTFPFPPVDMASGRRLDALGKDYDEFRTTVSERLELAMTDLYNRFHDPGEKSEDIARLRALHVELDQAVAAAYGWRDLDLGHGFHESKQGIRYTISESARRAVLDRLLALNHRRYAEEVKAGLHDKGAKKGRAKRPRVKPDDGHADLFGPIT